MRSAIKQIISDIPICGLGEGEILIKFSLEAKGVKIDPNLLELLHTLPHKYSEYLTIELNNDNFSDLKIDPYNDRFSLNITMENEKTFNIIVPFAAVLHFLDTTQNVSIELEPDNEC